MPLQATETSSERFDGLDSWPDAAVLSAFLEGQMAAVAAVQPALPAIATAVAAAVPRLAAGGRLIYVGAGTSGRIGVQDGVELPPTFDWPPDRLLLLMAGGRDAFTRSIEGAEDDRATAERDIAGAGPADVVLGIAASGTTPYTLACVQAARARGALTIGIANSPHTPLLAASEHPILAATGAEVIAGSTRMKAGTAQKIVLNLFSSLLMVRLGRVYRGQMVDMIAANEKLRRRAERMLMSLTGRNLPDVQAALTETRGRVKPAVLVLEGMTGDAATALLARHGGHLRPALAALRAG
jgi:N-acetylmuramic acid 6-phosphate etherase